MEKTYFQRVSEMTPTKVWINNPTREQARQAIAAGAVGCTTNPAYLGKLFDDSAEGLYVRGLILEELAGEANDTRVLEKVYSRLVKGLAEIFYPIYEKSHGARGYVSIQGDPFDESEGNILRYAIENRRLAENITPKVPFVESAVGAVKQLLREGVPLNITEVMAMHQALDVHEIYEEAVRERGRMPVVYYSHIMGIFNEYIAETIAAAGIDIQPDIAGQAGIVVARKMAQVLGERSSGIEMISGGARTVENFTDMVGAHANVTINWHGTFDTLLGANPPVTQKFLQPSPDSVVDGLLEKLPEFKRAYMINGLAPEEYEEYGPVVKFRNQFQAGWKAALAKIKSLRGEKGQNQGRRVE